ncbi:MAG: MBL fold metallo-hydrolase [Oscillospiraceae bacterium]|jgi:glyoxylase-like metal-dependent hydrolase (beta-lactamase superfamily II)|nr:MBL fold metallo-hydrolase [Oscillospiraceae bacterium]
MLIKTLVVGQLETNCYVVTDEATLECVIIDPGAESNTILAYIEGNNLIPRAVFITHGHFDHTMALPDVLEQTDGLPVYVHAREMEVDDRSAARLRTAPDLRFYAEGDEIEIGALRFRVLETPGHTLGSVVLLAGDAKSAHDPAADNALFTGDTLFRGSCGRTDLGGDMELMQQSLRRLSALPGDYEVYPGHAETTTLDNERRFNYYVLHANSEFPDQA